MVIDLETSISDTIHGPSGVYPKNDFYTFISKRQGEPVNVVHKREGFRRLIPVSLDGIKVIVGHNIKFDMLYFWKDPEFQKFLLRGGYCYDTQLAEYLLTGQRHKMSSLAELQYKYLGEVEKPSRISALFKKGIGADKILKHKRASRVQKLFHQYSLADGVMTERVFLEQYKKIKISGMWPIVKMYNKYLLALTMMEHNGMPFDLDKVEHKSREYNLAALEYLKEIREIVSPIWPKKLPEFNPGSGDHLSAVFFGGELKIKEKVQQGYYKDGVGYKIKFKGGRTVDKDEGDLTLKEFKTLVHDEDGAELIRYSIKGKPKYKLMELPIQVGGLRIKATDSLKTKKKGVYKTDKAVLQKIAQLTSSPGRLATLILEMRALNKLASTYFPSYLERQIDGYVHPTYRNTQTITGRLSCINPNFQNIPKGGEVESLIAPLNKDWTCLAIDYSQLEVYILAYSAGCTKLIEDIENGLDQHCQSLSYAVGKSYSEVKELVSSSDEWANKRKKIGKPITFGIQYGASPATIAKNAGITKEEAEAVLERYYQEYPEIKQFFETIRQDIENSSTLCKKNDVNTLEQKVTKNGRRFKDGVELLPIKDWDTGDNSYRDDLPRHIGYFRSMTGRKYSYESDGSVGFDGGVREVFRQPIIQNYAIQGTAGDVQCASSVSMFESLLRHSDKIRLVNEIHDSKWFIVKKDYLESLIPAVVWHMEKGFKEVMKEILGIDFPSSLKVDVEVGPNFAELKEFRGVKICKSR